MKIYMAKPVSMDNGTIICSDLENRVFSSFEAALAESIRDEKNYVIKTINEEISSVRWVDGKKREKQYSTKRIEVAIFGSATFASNFPASYKIIISEVEVE